MKDHPRSDNSKHRDVFAILARYLRSQGRFLEEVSDSKEVAEAFLIFANFIQNTPRKELVELVTRQVHGKSQPLVDDILNLSLDQMEALIKNPDVVRRTLETIAIERFHVPKGSMRSFSTVAMLREKLSLLIENARTHLAISDIASREQKSP